MALIYSYVFTRSSYGYLTPHRNIEESRHIYLFVVLAASILASLAQSARHAARSYWSTGRLPMVGQNWNLIHKPRLNMACNLNEQCTWRQTLSSELASSQQLKHATFELLVACLISWVNPLHINMQIWPWCFSSQLAFIIFSHVNSPGFGRLLQKKLYYLFL